MILIADLTKIPGQLTAGRVLVNCNNCPARSFVPEPILVLLNYSEPCLNEILHKYCYFGSPDPEMVLLLSML